MSSADAWEDMAICQQGELMYSGHHTGAVCRKPAACRQERGCYFVAAVQAHCERAERLGISPFDWLPDPKPHKARVRVRPVLAARASDRRMVAVQERLL